MQSLHQAAHSYTNNTTSQHTDCKWTYNLTLRPREIRNQKETLVTHIQIRVLVNGSLTNREQFLRNGRFGNTDITSHCSCANRNTPRSHELGLYSCLTHESCQCYTYKSHVVITNLKVVWNPEYILMFGNII